MGVTAFSGEIDFLVYNEQMYKVYLFCYVHWLLRDERAYSMYKLMEA